MEIQITVGSVSLAATLNDTPTAKRIAEILPVETGFQTWGDEIYFGVPVKAGLDVSAREEVEIGDLGYWPSGRAFCIFFGPTPMSREGGRPVPASAVNVIGRVKGDATRLKAVMDEAQVSVKALEQEKPQQ